MLRYYLWFLGFSLIFVFLLNILLGATFLYAFASVLFGALFIFLLDALIAWVIHCLPPEWFNHKNKIYTVSKKERKIYEKLGIKNWKDKVPEMGQLCNFKKDKLENLNEDYIKKFLTETCYAEIIHYGMLLIGLFVLFIFPSNVFFSISLPLFFINAILQIPPIFIQRYNRPKLEMALMHAERLKNK